MIKVVKEEKLADICDTLLTKLIIDEKNYDNTVDDSIIVKDYFKNVIKNENNILMCYLEDESVAGYIYLKYVKDDNYLIDGLYVVDEYRNRGIATSLINEGINMLKTRNVKYIDINVLFNNEIAYKLYKSLGFNEFKITMRNNL